MGIYIGRVQIIQNLPGCFAKGFSAQEWISVLFAVLSTRMHNNIYVLDALFYKYIQFHPTTLTN